MPAQGLDTRVMMPFDPPAHAPSACGDMGTASARDGQPCRPAPGARTGDVWIGRHVLRPPGHVTPFHMSTALRLRPDVRRDPRDSPHAPTARALVALWRTGLCSRVPRRSPSARRRCGRWPPRRLLPRMQPTCRPACPGGLL